MMIRTWPANPADTAAYTLDLEEWLLCEIVVDPAQYASVRQLVSARDMHRDMHQWLLAAMERLTARNGTPLAIAPVTLSLEVAMGLRQQGHKHMTPQLVAAWLAEHLRDCPPLGGNLVWCAGEIRRLAEARGVKHENRIIGYCGLPL